MYIGSFHPPSSIFTSTPHPFSPQPFSLTAVHHTSTIVHHRYSPFPLSPLSPLASLRTIRYVECMGFQRNPPWWIHLSSRVRLGRIIQSLWHPTPWFPPYHRITHQHYTKLTGNSALSVLCGCLFTTLTQQCIWYDFTHPLSSVVALLPSYPSKSPPPFLLLYFITYCCVLESFSYLCLIGYFLD